MLVYLVAASPFRARILSNGRPQLLVEVERVSECERAKGGARLGEAQRASRFAADLAAYLDQLGTGNDPVRLILAAPRPLLGNLDDCLRASRACHVVSRLEQDLGGTSLRRIASLARESLIGARQPIPERRPLKPCRDDQVRRSLAFGSLRERSSRSGGGPSPVPASASASLRARGRAAAVQRRKAESSACR